MTAPECLRTSRLQLRKPVPEDAAFLFEAYGQDPEVARYVPWRPHRSLSESAAVIERFLSGWETGSGFHWLLFPRAGAGLAGAVGIRREMHRVELGYVLARPFWGQGLMAEAAAAVVEWTFSDPSISRVDAICDVENERSVRVLEKLGFCREGILRQWALHPIISPIPRDCFSYVKTRNA